jgi:hypothetical protein
LRNGAAVLQGSRAERRASHGETAFNFGFHGQHGDAPTQHGGQPQRTIACVAATRTHVSLLYASTENEHAAVAATYAHMLKCMPAAWIGNACCDQLITDTTVPTTPRSSMASSASFGRKQGVAGTGATFTTNTLVFGVKPPEGRAGPRNEDYPCYFRIPPFDPPFDPPFVLPSCAARAPFVLPGILGAWWSCACPRTATI